MNRLFSFSALIIASVAIFASAQTLSSRRFLTGPYLQNVTSTSIIIMYELPANCSGSVRYGTDTTYGQTKSVISLASGGSTWVYKSLLSGLQSSTRYHYKVVTDSSMSADNTFVTAPASSADFSFGVWGDSQGTNHGTATDPLEPTKSMMRHMADSAKVDLALTTGDLAENGNSYSDDRTYFLDRVVNILGKKVPFYIAWGNHDWGYSSVMRNFVDLPSRNRTGYTPGWGSYSFNYAGCHFICIDYNNMSADIPSWVTTDLQSSASQNARFRFLFIHTPPYCELWVDGDAGLRSSLVPLLEQYNVDICFSGHTHEYEHGSLNGVHYCITGGGSWLDTPESVVKDWPHMIMGGATNLSSTIRAGLVNEYIKVDITDNICNAKMMAFYPDGRFMGVLDSFSITGSPVKNALKQPVASFKPKASTKQVFDLRGICQGTWSSGKINNHQSLIPAVKASAGIYVMRNKTGMAEKMIGSFQEK